MTLSKKDPSAKSLLKSPLKKNQDSRISQSTNLPKKTLHKRGLQWNLPCSSEKPRDLRMAVGTARTERQACFRVVMYVKQVHVHNNGSLIS